MTKVIIVNASAFELSDEQLEGMRQTPKIWKYIREEAEYSADVDEGEPVSLGDIRCAALNCCSVASPQENMECGLGDIWTVADMDGRYWEYAWIDGKWTIMK